jgi:hypothetical protein
MTGSSSGGFSLIPPGTKIPGHVKVLGSSPHRLAYDLAMIQCAWVMKELEKSLQEKDMFGKHHREYVSFACDECEQYSHLAGEAYLNLKNNNPNAEAYMGIYSTKDDKSSGVMQAADAVVFEIRRALNLALGQWKGELRPQFKKLTMFIVQHTKKEQLLRIVATHKPSEPFKLDEIMEQVFEEDVKLKI